MATKITVKKAGAKQPAKKLAVKTAAKPKKTAKKAVKKKPTKKITIKSQSSKKKSPLFVSSADTAFYATNGAVVRSMLELFDELATMLEKEFKVHATNAENNHFAIWVRDVLGDEDCAEELRVANTRRKARSVLKRHLEKYITN